MWAESAIAVTWPWDDLRSGAIFLAPAVIPAIAADQAHPTEATALPLTHSEAPPAMRTLPALAQILRGFVDSLPCWPADYAALTLQNRWDMPALNMRQRT